MNVFEKVTYNLYLYLCHTNPVVMGPQFGHLTISLPLWPITASCNHIIRIYYFATFQKIMPIGKAGFTYNHVICLVTMRIHLIATQIAIKLGPTRFITATTYDRYSSPNSCNLRNISTLFSLNYTIWCSFSIYFAFRNTNAFSPLIIGYEKPPWWKWNLIIRYNPRGLFCFWIWYIAKTERKAIRCSIKISLTELSCL